MPKIDAPTVAEHRAARRAALLDAARSMLADPRRTAPPSISEIASRAGMSRPAVYSYFASRDELLQAAVHDAYPRWEAYVVQAMAAARTPAGRVLAYVEANLHLFARGDHTLIRALAAPAASRRSGDLAHHSIRIPLTAALADLGVAQPERMSELIQSVMFTASRMVEEGVPEQEAYGLVRDLLGPYVRR